MYARVIMIGRLGRKPELKALPDGKSVAKFSLATQEMKNEETSWWNVTAFGAQADYCHTYLDKGSLVTVEGRISINTYTNKEGQKVSATNITATRVIGLEKKTSDTATSQQPGQQAWEQQSSKPSQITSFDDLPF